MPITIIQPTDKVSISRAIINANLAYLFSLIGGGGGSVASGVSSSLNFPSIPSGDSWPLTFTATGAVAGNPCFVGPPAAWDANLSFCAFISAANTIKVIVTNTKSDGTEIDPPAGTWTWVAF